MFLVFAFILSFICYVFDSSFACSIPIIAVTLICQLIIVCSPKSDRHYLSKMFYVITSVYILLSIIFSFSFGRQLSFIVFDPQKYIDQYIDCTSLDFDLLAIINNYTTFDDSNQLHKLYISAASAFANYSLGGSTVMYLTLCHTIFGIIASLFVYKILRTKLDVDVAYRYAVVFCLCSLFLFYSCLIIRDIIIVCLFTIATYIIVTPYKTVRFFYLVGLMLLIWGVRLYSGLFFASFVFIYLYAGLQNTRKALVTIPLLLFAILAVVSVLLEGVIIEQTKDELDFYSEFTAGENGTSGLTARLSQLPFGIKQIALLLFSPVRPFPPLSIYNGVETFSNFCISSTMLIGGLYWFFLFYHVHMGVFVYTFWTKMSIVEKLLFLASLAFLLANMAHPDVRRSMPVFPFLFYVFAQMDTHQVFVLPKKKINTILITIYAGMLLVFYTVK